MTNYYRNLYFIGFLCIVLQCFNVSGQTAYDFSYSTGAYTNLSGSTSLNNGQTWDDPEYHIPIGFTFEFFDQSFDSLHISDYIWFDVSNKYRIYAYDSDFIDQGTSTSLSPISYLLTGTPGSQILKIEWQNAGFYDDDTENDFINVQLWLLEGSNDIEVHIGQNSVLNVGSYGGAEGGVIGLVDKITDVSIFLVGDPASPVQLQVTSGIHNLNGTPDEGSMYGFEKCPSAVFSSVIDSGLTVNLSASLNPDITSYYWDFGDGSWDTVATPVHTYLDTGSYDITLVVYSNCNPDTSNGVVYMGVTNIDEHLLFNHQMRIYPNPTDDLLNISFEAHPKLESVNNVDEITVRIVDIMGRTIYSGENPIINGSLNSTIDLSSYETGSYFVQVQAGNLEVFKLIVKY